MCSKSCKVSTKVYTIFNNTQTHAGIDETGKYKTNKCSVELFLSTCQKHGIDINDQIRDAVREKVIAGS